MRLNAASPCVPGTRLGAKIANSQGVPGTLGCVARGADDSRTVLLSSWHVLFGNGGSGSDVIWLVDEADGARRYDGLGRALYGKIGTVRFDGEDYFVDCAVGSCVPSPETPHTLPRIARHDTARPGDRVTKVGAATGTTEGIVVDVSYCSATRIAWRSYPAQRQLLVRSVRDDTPFASNGDSGAILVNARNDAVGLLWGTNCRGEAVACHIAPVLRAMNVTLPAAGV